MRHVMANLPCALPSLANRLVQGLVRMRRDKECSALVVVAPVVDG